MYVSNAKNHGADFGNSDFKIFLNLANFLDFIFRCSLQNSIDTAGSAMMDTPGKN